MSLPRICHVNGPVIKGNEKSTTDVTNRDSLPTGMDYAHTPEDQWVSPFMGTKHGSTGREGGDRNGFVQTLMWLATCSSISHPIALSSTPPLQSFWEPVNNLLLFIKNTQLGTQLGFSHPLPQPLLLLAQISVEVLILKTCIVHDAIHCHKQVPVYRNNSA